MIWELWKSIVAKHLPESNYFLDILHDKRNLKKIEMLSDTSILEKRF